MDRSQNIPRSRLLPITSSPTRRWRQFDERDEQLLSSDQIKASFSTIHVKQADVLDSIEDSSAMTTKIADEVLRKLDAKRNKDAFWSKIQRSPVQGIDRVGVMILVAALALLLNFVCTIQLSVVKSQTDELITDKLSMDESLESILSRIRISHKTAGEVLSKLAKDLENENAREIDQTLRRERDSENRYAEIQHNLVLTSERINSALETQLAQINTQLTNAVLFRKTTADYISKLAHIQGSKDGKP